MEIGSKVKKKAAVEETIDFGEETAEDRYTAEVFHREVLGTDLDKLVSMLKYKKNIILQGAPGVGKTYTARRLAYYMIGSRKDENISQVQFHQSYTYEDFMVGLRPNENGGFQYDKGAFYKICEKARQNKGEPHFIIIDEINRGNISMILGEAFSLIEKEYRDKDITLKYKSEKFNVPSNLYIIGTMNTADRGLVTLDYALRRRFSFYTVPPAFKTAGFREYVNRAENQKFNGLIRRISQLNDVIKNDEMLGEGFMIGHSYFMGGEITDERLRNIVNYEIVPLLNEYWVDDPDMKNKEWEEKLLGEVM